MINEIFVSDWSPVTPLPLMTPEQKDNELERIYEGFLNDIPRWHLKSVGSGGDVSRRRKRILSLEFGRGFRNGFIKGVVKGNGEAKTREDRK